MGGRGIPGGNQRSSAWGEPAELELERPALDLECQARGLGLCPEDTGEPPLGGLRTKERRHGSEVESPSSHDAEKG